MSRFVSDGKTAIGSWPMTAPTTRETADHIGEANEKVSDHVGDATTMIDHAELARLAEAATQGEWWSDDDVISHQEVSRDDERFIYAFSPAVCSALLSEIAALRGDVAALDEMRGTVRLIASRLTQVERQRDEAWGLLRELADGRSQKSNINEYDDLSVRASTLLTNQGADQ